MIEVAIGVDIGATNTKLGIVDSKGNVLSSIKVKTTHDPNIEVYLNDLNNEIKRIIDDYREPLDVRGIGIGAPDVNYYKGTIEKATNLIWKDIVPFVDLFKKYTNLPIYLTNDANAAAIGEMTYGGAKQMMDFVVITMGTGLGSGIVVNGKIVHGYNGFAGEIGHTTVNYNGRNCGCGRKGCLETYVSATGIKRTVYKLLADYLEDMNLSSLTQGKNIFDFQL